MALIKCADCGKEISDKAKECPNCGCPVEYTIQTIAEEKAKEVAPIVEPLPEENIGGNTKDSEKGFFMTKIKEKYNENKKPFIIGGIVIVVVLIFIICMSCSGNDKETSYDNNLYDYEEDSEDNDNNYDIDYEDDYEDVDTPKISYISDRTVDYDEVSKKYRVFFGLKDQNENYMSANSGTATIEIKSEAEEVLCSKTVTFTSSDFGSWTSKLNGTRTLACIYIDLSEVKEGSSSKGTLTLSVLADKVSFSPKSLIIYDLPVKNITISTPSLPKSFSDYDYNDNIEATARVEKIEFDSTVFGVDDVSVKMKMTATTTYNSTPNKSKNISIGYKLKNSSGVIVDSGTFYLSPSTTGESSIKETYINVRLSMKETYTLELLDSTD